MNEYESILMDYACTRCGAEPGKQCKTKSGALTVGHNARRLQALNAGRLPLTYPLETRWRAKTLYIEMPAEMTDLEMSQIAQYVHTAMNAGHVPNTKTCETCAIYVDAVFNPSHLR